MTHESQAAADYTHRECRAESDSLQAQLAGAEERATVWQEKYHELRAQLKESEERNVEWERKYAWRTASLDMLEASNRRLREALSQANGLLNDAHRELTIANIAPKLRATIVIFAEALNADTTGEKE